MRAVVPKTWILICHWFQILEILSKSTCGCVYRVLRLEDKRHMAMKCESVKVKTPVRESNLHLCSWQLPTGGFSRKHKQSVLTVHSSFVLLTMCQTNGVQNYLTQGMKFSHNSSSVYSINKTHVDLDGVTIRMKSLLGLFAIVRFCPLIQSQKNQASRTSRSKRRSFNLHAYWVVHKYVGKTNNFFPCLYLYYEALSITGVIITGEQVWEACR